MKKNSVIKKNILKQKIAIEMLAFHPEMTNKQLSRELKLDYKMKGPLGVWFSVLNNEKNNINIGTLGLGYFFKTKKWDLALLTEKSFYDKDYTDEELSENQEFYEYKLGWLYHLKKKYPFLSKICKQLS